MVEPVRLQLSRRKGFDLQAASMAANGLPAVNVARPSKWGNPWKIADRAGGWFIEGPRVNPFQHPCGNRGGAQILAVQCFRDEPEGAASLDVSALRGKNLACWCALPKPGEPDICHAAVLLELANSPICEALP